MLSIGLMSGTSMDGIDAALMETNGSPALLRPLGHISLSYHPAFRKLLKAAEGAIRECAGDIDRARAYFPQACIIYLQQSLNIPSVRIKEELKVLSAYLNGPTRSGCDISFDDVVRHSTLLHSRAVKKLLQATGFQASQIDIVGYHGQTFYHQPLQQRSVILGDGQWLADNLKIAVINDFREQDIALGGHGAPFAPLYHQAMAIRDDLTPIAVVNCGGIANVSFIPNEKESDVVAFDTGPGNTLIDTLVKKRTLGAQSMDVDGRYGLQGKVNTTVVEALYETSIVKNGQSYFSMPPPKSLDVGDIQLIDAVEALSLEDACATLAAFTADSIARSTTLISTATPLKWVLAGGGWKNQALYQYMKSCLTKVLGEVVHVQRAQEIGWDGDAMEAQVFAYLAVRSIHNMPLSMPGTTNVSVPTTGGTAYLPKGGGTDRVQALIHGRPASPSLC